MNGISIKIAIVFLVHYLMACHPIPPTEVHESIKFQSKFREFNDVLGKQMAMPEYSGVSSVIVHSSLVTDFQGLDLIEAILESEVDAIWMFRPLKDKTRLEQKIASNLDPKLREHISKIKMIDIDSTAETTVWARDWAPLFVRRLDQQGNLKLLDFRYYNERAADDRTGQALEELLGVTRLSLPIYFEGGNFMINKQGHCMMTHKVLHANVGGDSKRGKDLYHNDTIAFFTEVVGCRKVFFFGEMPYEDTGHIDLWAKFLNDQTVAIAELRFELLKYLKITDFEKFRAFLRVQTYLDARAAEMEKFGYRVVRMPMLLPYKFKDSKVFNFRSYTNSLFVNGTALVPRFIKGPEESYPDHELIETYEKEIEKIYRDAGFRVRFIPADHLIRFGGAVHCVTMQVPRVS